MIDDKEYVVKILEEVARKEKFVDYTIDIKNTSNKGEGYSSEIVFASIAGKRNEHNENKQKDFVVKCGLKSNNEVTNDSTHLTFIVEAFVYERVLKEFAELQKQKSHPDPFRSTTKCFSSCTEKGNESIVLKDIKERGYKLWNRKIPMNRAHLEFVLKEYGKYHALSFAMNQLRPESFKKLSEYLIEGFGRKYAGEHVEIIKKIYAEIGAYMDANGKTKEAERLRKYLEKDTAEMVEDVYRIEDKYSVICHGDCWINNIMFKYQSNEDEEKPSEMCLLDWQMAQYTAPTADVAYFFYSSSPPELYKDYESYLRVYHDALLKHLEEFGLNAKLIYPYEELKRQWTYSSRFAMLACAFVFKALVLDEDEDAVPDIAAAEEGTNPLECFFGKFSKTKEYNEKCAALIQHLVENEWL